MDQSQFATYLAQGLGRPYLYLQHHDPAPYSNALLQACLYNPTYDGQSEGSRTAYLYELIQLTSMSAWFRLRLLDALADPDDTMDLEQLFDFALIYARAGDSVTRRLLYERAGEQASQGDTTGAYQLIDLDGVAGFLFIANRLGEAMQSDPALWDNDHLLRHLKSSGADSMPDQLRTAAYPNYPFVSTYLEAVAATEAHRRVTPRPQLVGKPYTYVKNYIEHAQGRASFPLLRRWGAAADDGQLHPAALDSLQQSDPQRLAAYLTIFGKRAFPLGIEPLIPFVWNSHERIARWSIQALSQFEHPSVRELGFTLIQAQHYVSTALSLFINNYQVGDDRYLAALLAQTVDRDALHDIGSGLNEIFTIHSTPDAATIFLDLYERGPCSLCRERFVERLIEIDRLPPWMEQETRYDVNPEIHQIIIKYLAERQ